jgi:hypothetical protein
MFVYIPASHTFSRNESRPSARLSDDEYVSKGEVVRVAIERQVLVANMPFANPAFVRGPEASPGCVLL